MEQKIENPLLVKQPVKLMFELSLPAVIGMLVISLYPLADGIFAGNLIGQNAMAACSIALPLTFINNGISTLLGVGLASILSRALGRGDWEIINKVMGNLIFWVLLFSSIISILGILLAPYFLSMVGATGEIKEFGIRYLRVIFIGSLFVNFAQAANMIMRAEGLMKKAMVIMVFGALLNIILDPIFMVAMGEYAIEGAAIATLVAQFTQASITLWYFLKKSKKVRIYAIAPSKEICIEMFSIGFSAMIMQVLFMIQQILLYQQAFAYGGDTNGILMSAALRMYAFCFIPLWGMSQGLQPIIGANYGAGKLLRIRETMRVFYLGSLALAFIFWLPPLFLTEQILFLFGVSKEIIPYGLWHFRLFYSIFVLYGIIVMSIAFFQAIGAAKKSAMIVIFRQLILFLPAIFILPMFFGINGVWLAQPFVDFVMIVVGVVMVLKELKKMEKTDWAKS